MATRRMFSIRLLNSARFLRMPISSQALYFHLGLRADDDGVVEAYPVIRLVGCTEDDLRVLISKGFVRVLNDDLVTYITDWNEHNSIRADRKIDSIYKDLLLELIPDARLVEKRDRADLKRLSDGQPMDNQRTAQDRTGKDRTGKNKKDIYMSEFEELWALYPKKQGKAEALQKYIKARNQGASFEDIRAGIEAYKAYLLAEKIDKKFVKMGSTFFSQQSWQDDWSIKDEDTRIRAQGADTESEAEDPWANFRTPGWENS